MTLFKVCSEDPILKELRKQYRATPLRVPENRIRPLGVVAVRKRKADYRGDLQHLINNPQELNIPVQESEVADISSQRTRNISIDVGIKLLGGFLEGFGINAGSISPVFTGARSISFSFQGVKRFHIDKNQFGNAIKDHSFNVDDAALEIFQRDKDPFKFFLINSTITANKILLHFDANSKSGVELDLPLEQVVSNLKADTKVQLENQKTISFESNSDLTFAFTSFELGIEWTKGKVDSLMTTRYDLPIPLGEVEDHLEVEEVLTGENELLGWDSIN